MQIRVDADDFLITSPLISEERNSNAGFEQDIIAENEVFLSLMQKEKLKSAYRPVLIKPQGFSWGFNEIGLRLKFYLPAGSYTTALIRE